jgi:trimethylamine--corrinoid protein Co-methyltransferase
MVRSRASLGNRAGHLESNLVTSYEQLLIDNEIIGTVNRVTRGVDFDDDALALDLIADIGPGRTFISSRHTMEHFRKEHMLPLLSDGRHYASWKKEGAKTPVDTAREKAMEILRANEPEPLNRDVDKAISGIIDEAREASARTS